MPIEICSEFTCYGGRIGFYAHHSREMRRPMRFAVFVPAEAALGPVPALYVLPECGDGAAVFMERAGALRLAAATGLMLVCADNTQEATAGAATGFYLDPPTTGPAPRPARYADQELPAIVETHFPASRRQRGLCGHGCGGLAALTLALRAPHYWQTVSAFAPLGSTGSRATSAYRAVLGDEPQQWQAWDPCALLAQAAHPQPLLIDHGAADAELDSQRRPQDLQTAASAHGQVLRQRLHPGYDASYWFIQSVVADHFAHHAARLKRPATAGAPTAPPQAAEPATVR